MSCRLPIIAIAVVGIDEIIQNGINRYMVNKGDMIRIRGYIISLMLDVPMRKEIGLNARREMDKSYSPKKIQTETIKVFMEIAQW